MPIVQCLQIKPMPPTGAGGDRYRLVIADGNHYVQSMLATQANHVIHDNKLQRGCLIRVKQYQANSIKGRK